MAQITYGDLAGSYSFSAAQAIQFVSIWFRDDDRICLVGRKSKKTGNHDTLSQSMLVSEFKSFLTDEFLKNLIEGEDEYWNLYFTVAPIKEDVSLFRRGTDDNIARIPGVWADLDLKEGGFSSQEEILAFLASLALQPTAVVGSGSGGVHAYWKLVGKQVEPGNTREANKEMLLRWWSYLDEMAGEERKIDRLIDLTRIFRLPGSAYFPREDSDGKMGSVQLLQLSGVEHPANQIFSISEEAYQKKLLIQNKITSDDRARLLTMGETIKERMFQPVVVDGGIPMSKFLQDWSPLLALANLETFVNETYAWSEILLPMGWTYLRPLQDGSNEWARPGRRERSAVTDYKESDDAPASPVMSLLSSSEDTGIVDLYDGNIPLTKFRVLLRYQYGDNGTAMIEDLMEDVLAWLKEKESLARQIQNLTGMKG